MESSKKILLTTIGIAILVVFVSGVTFAFFNYTRTGASNNIRVGRIYFNSNQTNTINLDNLFPIDTTVSGIMNDSTKVGTFELEITGDTDYSEGIEYLVSSVDSNIYTSTGKIVPISLDVEVTELGTPNANYFTARDNTNESIYKKIVGDTLVGDQMLLVGFIKPNTTSGQTDGIDGSITIKAYLDKNNILISDTYDGSESDNMGTTNSKAQGKTVITTSEWNALQNSGVSFKVKVEANEGIWVTGSLEEIMRKSAVMDNVSSDFVSASTGINFGAISSDTNGKGIYMRAGTENDTYPIVYYRGEIENNNVVFNNKCWKAVRTTDTGGVKLIYNGEPRDIYEKVALSENQYTIPSGATNDFTFNSSDNSWEIVITDNLAKEISFQVPAGDYYTIVQTGTSGASTGGQWTFYKDGTSVKSYGNGGGQPMNDTYEFGTLTSSNVIKWTYTGSSSVEGPITFKLQMVGAVGDLLTENGCDRSGVDTQITVNNTNAFPHNASATSMAYNGYMYGDVYTYAYGVIDGEYYDNTFVWNGTNYTLTDNATTVKSNNAHYSCGKTSKTATCITIKYYFSSTNFIELSGGDGIEKTIVKMQTNTNDSNVKNIIDTWYEGNMNTVTNKLEDTVWCNDRSVGDHNNNGWIANGGDLGTSLFYGARERSNWASDSSTVKNQPSLACANKNDRFTVNNSIGNRALTYPVALLTEDEIVLAGGVAGKANGSFYLVNESYWWTMSPSSVRGDASWFGLLYNDGSGSRYGYLTSYDADYYSGIRPSISLKPGTPVVSGTGTVSDPYVIE